ncbi:MAG: Stp1/IreP family PP2C-type Ser/Thr phosphatase [Myxococcales bacterium]|nr:Stp1/IreP family PP2C-type Ser/Thr phosphatase [Myxococcales bacterium]
MRVTAEGETNVGRKRAHNEDNYLMFPERHLFVVADGMGGHACGEVASAMVVEAMRDYFGRAWNDPDATWPGREERNRSASENMLNAGIRWCNYSIWEKGHADTKFKNMGTTVVALHVDDDHVNVAHVGDSRVYRFRAGNLHQVTEDHSLLNDYKKMAVLTPEEEANFPHKNIIVRACGLKDNVLVDVQKERPEPGDIYILCSDGLSGEVPDPQIRDIMDREKADLKAMVAKLVQTACENGGKDNVTCIAVRIEAL